MRFSLVRRRRWKLERAVKRLLVESRVHTQQLLELRRISLAVLKILRGHVDEQKRRPVSFSMELSEPIPE